MTAKLKPCPFCGAPAELLGIDGEGGYLRCSNNECLVQPSVIAPRKRGRGGRLSDAWNERPLAMAGLISYRYNGPFGWVMIGATDHLDAMREANRSLTGARAKPENLEIWNVFRNCYEPVIW